MKIGHRLLALAFLVLSTSLLNAQSSLNTTKLNAFFDSITIHDQNMGSVSITKNGKVLYERAIGEAYLDGDNSIKATPQTEYRIGSITKSLTATMILQAVESGKLTLETKLDLFFPEIENAKEITIEHLLQHRSGIHNFTNDSLYMTYHEKTQSRKQLVKIIKDCGSDFAPGTQTSYSNSAYVLLTFILEDIYKKQYADVLNENIVQKIGLTKTKVGEKIDVKANQAYSYQRMNNEWEPDTETDMTVPQGAGSIISTPTEINQFYTALLQGKLVKMELVEKMKTLVDGMGYGLFQFPFGEKQAYGHTGGIDGFRTMAGYFPADSLAVTYFSNGVHYSNNDILIGMLSIYYGEKFEIPVFKASKLIDEKILGGYDGTYAAPAFPLKITISHDKNTLIAQATGQPSFPLEAKDDKTFEFKPAGVVLEFNASGEMTLKQGGGEYVLKKE